MESTTTTNQVAVWMVDTLKAKGSLYYRPTLQFIRQQFGPAYVRVNLRGNAVISAEVLAEFRRLAGDHLFWNNNRHCWRLRKEKRVWLGPARSDVSIRAEDYAIPPW